MNWSDSRTRKERRSYKRIPPASLAERLFRMKCAGRAVLVGASYIEEVERGSAGGDWVGRPAREGGYPDASC